MNKTKNYKNPKNCNKGVTLISLVIYMTVMFVVLALVMRIMTHFGDNMAEVSDVTFETEFEKFNMYMLDETSITGNEVNDYSNNKIEFFDGNIFEFKDENNDGIGEIYFNEIKLCKEVESCVFNVTKDLETLNSTITITIDIKDNLSTLKYVIPIHTTRIPLLFQEVEYIESTGTQYIDLDIFGTNNHGAEIEYAFTSKSSNDSARLFGTRNGASGDGSFAFISSWSGDASSYLYIASNYTAPLNATTNKIDIDYNWHTISCNVLNDKKIYYDATLIGTGNNTEFVANDKASLFRTYNRTAYGQPSKARVKSLKIYNNGVLIMDCIPCYRQSDGEAGLYDLIGNKFYKNNGTGAFIKGDNINEIQERDYVVSTKIPKAYQEVEYISTPNNGAYIDTGIIPSDDLGYKIEVNTLDKTTERAILGTREFSGRNPSFWIGYSNNRIYYSWNDSYPVASNRPVTNESIFDIIEVNYKNSKKFKVNGTVYGTDFPSLATFTQSFCLMGRNVEGSCAGREQTMKYAIFTNQDIITHYYVPCYRKVDGEIGLYDIIEEKFCTKSGTGEFFKGPDVN